MSKFEINRSGVFFIINVNAILTLQLSPHVGHFDRPSIEIFLIYDGFNAKTYQNKISCYLFDHRVNLDKCLLNILNAYKLCNDFDDFQIFTRLRQRLSSFLGG
jgi:hypothetical protein